MTLAHARHNENLCDFINDNGEYNDWVVTTAFYSALQYVNYKLFPGTYDGDHYTTFARYYSAKFTRGGPSKHSVTKNLVRAHLNEISPSYNKLFDACYSARYRQYRVSSLIADECRKQLLEIKTLCSPPPVPTEAAI